MVKRRLVWVRLDAPIKVKDIPQRPGVYCFFGETGKMLYAGMSRDLRKRIYMHMYEPRTKWVLAETWWIKFKVTSREWKAAALEGMLLERVQPKYNKRQTGRTYSTTRVVTTATNEWNSVGHELPTAPIKAVVDGVEVQVRDGVVQGLWGQRSTIRTPLPPSLEEEGEFPTFSKE